MERRAGWPGRYAGGSRYLGLGLLCLCRGQHDAAQPRRPAGLAAGDHFSRSNPGACVGSRVWASDRIKAGRTPGGGPALAGDDVHPDAARRPAVRTGDHAGRKALGAYQGIPSGVSELGSDPAIAISGNYLHGASTAMDEWKWIWGCNHDQLPKVSLVNADDYLLKIDINITAPLSSPSYGFTAKLGGNDIYIGKIGLDNGDGTYSTPGWITISFDLSTFDSLPDDIPASGDWGITYRSNAGEPIDFTAVYMDNMRIEHK